MQATALGSQAMDAWMNSHLDDARKKAREELAANGELAGLSEEAVNKRVEASATYKEAEANYGVGSTYWTAGTAVTGLLSGVLGGLISSVSAQGLAKALYNKDAEELTSEEKSVVTTLVTALASAGGSVASGDTRGMVSAGNAARVEVENNSLGCSPTSCINSLVMISCAVAVWGRHDGWCRWCWTWDYHC
ncbi:VENN motif pre-toxin domain-containing protein [Mangrovibacter sp. SLW1]